MATLQATTCTSLTGNVISPKTFITSTDALQEWSGSVYLANNASSDIIGHVGYGYIWQVGTICFTGIMDSISWTFAYTDYGISYYGITSNTQISSEWGSWTYTHYSASPDANYVRFTNTSGSGGTFHFTVRCSSFVPTASSVLTRIK